MSEAGDRNIEAVQRLFETLDRADFSTLRDVLLATRERGNADFAVVAQSMGKVGQAQVELIDPEIVIDFSSAPTPFIDGDTFTGWEGWLRFWREWVEPWESYRVSGSEWAAAGDHVYCESEMRVTRRGAEIPVDVGRHQVWTLRDGKVVRFALYPTREEAFAAMGAASR
jgi:hypothetical protein